MWRSTERKSEAFGQRSDAASSQTRIGKGWKIDGCFRYVAHVAVLYVKLGCGRGVGEAGGGCRLPTMPTRPLTYVNPSKCVLAVAPLQTVLEGMLN